MRYFLFASHGKFADGILDSVELITGKHENIWTLGAYINEDEDIKDQISKVRNKLGQDDELIVVTDLFGGSVNNEFMNLLHDKRIHLISGLNLALVIELVTMSDHVKDPVQLINVALHNSKKLIQYCNQELDEVRADDEF